MNTGSKYSTAYYDHVTGKQLSTGDIAIVFDIVNDISGRSGLGDDFDNIDSDIQDEIVDAWLHIVKCHNNSI